MKFNSKILMILGTLTIVILSVPLAFGASSNQQTVELIYLPIINTPEGSTTRVSVSSQGEQGENNSRNAVISANGRYIAFRSAAADLIDLNNPPNEDWGDGIFVHDRITNLTEIVSLTSDGNYSGGGAVAPAISGDGRYIVFSSSATDIVPNDKNKWADIYLHDRQTHETILVSTSIDGTGGNLPSVTPYISPNGRFIVFASEASNLAPNDNNYSSDLFLYDQNTKELQQVTDGSYDVNLRFTRYHPSISNDGRYIAFGQRTNTFVDGDWQSNLEAILYNVETDENVILLDPNGKNVATPVISANGKHVAFQSIIRGDDPVYLYWYDLPKKEHIKLADSHCPFNETGKIAVSISGNGRFVAFCSIASNIVPEDTNDALDIFVYDSILQLTERVSVSSENIQGNDDSTGMSISDDGRFVAFTSSSTNLVANDTNKFSDVFVFDRAYE